MKTIFKEGHISVLLLAVFQIIVGVVHVGVLALSDPRIFTSAILAVFSFIAAFGLLASKKWAIWLVIALFFPQLAFGAATLNVALVNYGVSLDSTYLLLGAGFVVFIIVSFIAFAYVAAKRNSLLSPK